MEKKRELAALEKMQSALEHGTLASVVPLDEEEASFAASWNLLTGKPILYAANISETQLRSFDEHATAVTLGLPPDTRVIGISARLEEELQDLPPEEGKALLLELGVASSGLDRLIAAAYALLGYVSFFTAGPKEVRAWTIAKGMKAPQAAGVIHTDFEKGFIRAETIAYDDFIRCGGEQGAREVGKLRIEGKDYVVQDGDVMHFRFNV